MLLFALPVLYWNMKRILFIIIFLPAFLFAQKNAEFVVKKKKASYTMYYSRELIKAPEFTNYLWIVGKKICFYSSKETPTAEYNQTNVQLMLTDTFKCHNYTIEKDSIKFKEYSRVNQLGPYTYNAFYTFYQSGLTKMLRNAITYSTNQKLGGYSYKYTEFIPTKKE